MDLVQDLGGVMTMEDLAGCDAEVIEPIKYDFRQEKDNDGVTLWEVILTGVSLTKIETYSTDAHVVSAKWTRSYCLDSSGNRRGSRDYTWNRYAQDRA